MNYLNNAVLKTNLSNIAETIRTTNNNDIFNIVENRNLNLNKNFNYKTFTMHEDSNRDVKTYMGKAAPLTLVKIPVNKISTLSDETLYLLKFRYNDTNSQLSPRTSTKVPYFAFKQQRYKARKLIPMVSKQFTDGDYQDKVAKGNFTLNNTYSIETDLENPGRYYRMLRKNRIREEKMPVVVSKRLLRVKKTLVLPTHINITAVTNSYDVVHS